MDGKRRYGAVGGGIVLGAVFAAALSRPLPPPTAGYHPDIHSEYVKFLSGKDTVTAYIAYPERPQPAPAVIVIHEIFGMSDFIRQTTEQLAKDGFVAIAPDLLSRRGGTPASQDSARKLIATLNADTVTQDLDATRRYLNSLRPVRAKGLGVYAENDARIDAGLPDAAAAMRAAGKEYPYAIYPGVGHGFLRTREKPEVADSAWHAVIRFFRGQLKS